jgi:ATP-dependent DNA helicase PIF1
MVVLRAAPTGVAAHNISGRTLHSLLRLPTKLNSDTKISDANRGTLQRALQHCEYLIIDEKSMIGVAMLGCVDQRLRQAFPEYNLEPFGGISIILFGDFFQLPPVLQKPLYYADTTGKKPLKLPIEVSGQQAYHTIDRVFELEVVVRQQSDEPFRQALERFTQQSRYLYLL